MQLEEPILRRLVMDYARVRELLGDVLDDPSLVLPTSKFFPDEFRGDAPSVANFVRRMVGYSPVREDCPLALRFHEPESEEAKSCSSSGCGGKFTPPKRNISTGEAGYTLDLSTGDLGNATVFAAIVGRAVGELVVLEGGIELAETALGTTSEIVGVACGFGVLLLEGAAVYAKSCGGVSVHRATLLSVEELALALALFVRLHGLPLSSAQKHLSTTQAEALSQAIAWVDSNDDLVRSLREHPESVAQGLVTFRNERGAIGRFFQRLTARAESTPQPAIASAPKHVRERARALKADVEAALRDD